MNRLSVKSNLFKTVGYDKQTQTLELEFHNGTLYRYGSPETPFTPKDWEEFRSAESKGSYYSKSIRNHFPSSKVVPERAAEASA